MDIILIIGIPSEHVYIMYASERRIKAKGGILEKLHWENDPRARAQVAPNSLFVPLHGDGGGLGEQFGQAQVA
ncbi:MAG: hypothetical protein NTU78_14595, partial [Alphaproteobacteria bacterium]|nr:hypothetical protein [Alphaproteobacteria bacterium]